MVSRRLQPARWGIRSRRRCCGSGPFGRAWIGGGFHRSGGARSRTSRSSFRFFGFAGGAGGGLVVAGAGGRGGAVLSRRWLASGSGSGCGLGDRHPARQKHQDLPQDGNELLDGGLEGGLRFADHEATINRARTKCKTKNAMVCSDDDEARPAARARRCGIMLPQENRLTPRGIAPISRRLMQRSPGGTPC